VSCQVNESGQCEQWTGARQWQDCAVTEANLTYQTLHAFLLSLEWSNVDDLKVDCREWAARFGYEYIVRTSSESQVRFVCSHAGQPRIRTAGQQQSSRIRQSSSKKIGCSSVIKFFQAERGKYQSFRLTSGCFDHICTPDPALIKGGLLYVRQLTGDMRADIELMTKGNAKATQIRRALKEKFNLSFIEPGIIYTAMHWSRPKRSQPSQIDELLDHLDDLGNDVNYNCQWQEVMKAGEKMSEIRNVFWATNQMLRMFNAYGQLLIVDATYKSTQFDMKLLLFTARAGTGTFTVVAAALLQHETKDDLEWAFVSLMEPTGWQQEDLHSHD
jgi:MULE transposase domain